ncbi:MAG TPA: cytochrome c maturation protein CcmE [Bryobacteraceae bacterium]|jgi:cytochrome c-type biogenesis protein CcmE|nr:cytochrome c maturation protein CcmE [Bryobacteraceae bacterium]
MKKYGKFAALITIVVGTVVWLAVTGGKQSQAYYKTVNEVHDMGTKAYGQRLRLEGNVATGSIQHVGAQTEFVLEYQNTRMKVLYTGTDPLPDTLKDGAQALADGRLGQDQVFRAGAVQAKCASKYETKPGLAPGQTAPNINTGKSSI